MWSAAYINAPILQDSFSNGTIQPDSRIYFLHDANWDTTAVVGYDAATQSWGVVQRYVYSPYGSLTILNADFSTPPSGTQPMTDYLYQGMSLDPVSGLNYERNRNYSPSLGVWTSQDPLRYINGANTYRFVGSSPVGMADPEGLFDKGGPTSQNPNAAVTGPIYGPWTWKKVGGHTWAGTRPVIQELGTVVTNGADPSSYGIWP